jgi:hypothetical protein
VLQALALSIFLLQAPEVLPPSVGPELERIMSKHDLESRLGAGWTFGDAAIAPGSISVQVLHLGRKAAMLILERPPAGEALGPGAWFVRRVEVLTTTPPQIEAALVEIAADLERGFGTSPWKTPVSDFYARPFLTSGVVPCAFCEPASRQWPLHYTRHPWIPLALGALIVAVLGLGVFFGLRRSGALKGLLG